MQHDGRHGEGERGVAAQHGQRRGGRDPGQPLRHGRRREGGQRQEVRQHGDPNRRVASRAGRRLDLSPKEFAVLECLLAADGQVVSAEELLERVWDEAADPFTSAVKHTMHRLRAKLGDPPVIETIREGGYRIGPA